MSHMALSKLLAASLLVSILLLHLSDADQSLLTDNPATPSPFLYDSEAPSGTLTETAGSLVKQIDCNGACAVRCSKASRQRMCKRACGTCCRRCNCVPPGTSGNQKACPCYYNQTTHGGRRKCP